MLRSARAYKQERQLKREVSHSTYPTVSER
jgi:hypothetical protein